MSRAKTISLNPLAGRDGGRSEWRPGDYQERPKKCEVDGDELPPPQGEVREDTVMMVLMPLVAWRAVEELAGRLDLRPQEVISRALAEFKERLDKATSTE